MATETTAIYRWFPLVSGVVTALLALSSVGTAGAMEFAEEEIPACFTLEPRFRPNHTEEEKQFLSCFIVAYNDVMYDAGYRLEEIRILSDEELGQILRLSNATFNSDPEPVTSPSSFPSFFTSSGAIDDLFENNIAFTRTTGEDAEVIMGLSFEEMNALLIQHRGCPPYLNALFPLDSCSKYLNCAGGEQVGEIGTCPQDYLLNFDTSSCESSTHVTCPEGVQPSTLLALSPSLPPSVLEQKKPSSYFHVPAGRPNLSFRVTGIMLVDSDSNDDLFVIQPDAVLDLKEIGARLNIRVLYEGVLNGGSVRVALDDLPQAPPDATDPISLGAHDTLNNYSDQVQLVQMGNHTLTVTPFDSQAAQGDFFQVSFRVVGFGVSTFALYNTDTQTKIMTLDYSAVIDLADVGPKLTILAEVTGFVRSLTFIWATSLTEQGSRRTMNSEPFILGGSETVGGTEVFLPVPELGGTGEFKLQAIPFNKKDGTGVVGQLTEVHFKVIDSSNRRLLVNPTKKKKVQTIPSTGSGTAGVVRGQTFLGGKGNGCTKCPRENMPFDPCGDCTGQEPDRRFLEDRHIAARRRHLTAKVQELASRGGDFARRILQKGALSKNELMTSFFVQCLDDAHDAAGHFGNYAGRLENVNITGCNGEGDEQAELRN